jgi:hypothetical protein
MRAIIAFRRSQVADDLAALLARYEWDVDAPVRDATSMPPIHAFQAQATALRLQQTVENELARAPVDALSEDDRRDLAAAHEAQQEATVAQERVLAQEQGILTRRYPDQVHMDGAYHLGNEPASLQQLAAGEARAILDQIAAEDRVFADLTFQYPIYDRQTQTWGTVHFETGKRHVIIRLRNGQSEKLKAASSRLVHDLIRGDRTSPTRTKIRHGLELAYGRLRAVWMEPVDGSLPLEFDQIKVLEANSAREAFTGAVLMERSLWSVLRERRGDLRVAGVFLLLGSICLLMTSPLIFDFDSHLHFLSAKTWHNGWYAWVAGNAGRIATAFSVAIFLPIAQVLLYWREVRRRPIINWSA